MCVFMQNHKFNIAALTWSKQIRHFLPPPVREFYFFLVTKRNKILFAQYYFIMSAITQVLLKNLRFKVSFFQ